ncbi:hypothetical protein [Kribbella sp. DT2]
MTLIESHPDRSVDWLLARIGLTLSGTARLIDRLEGLGPAHEQVAPYG